MEVIGHKAISEDAHWSANTRLGHQVEERVGIVGLLKHNRPRISPIEDMIRVTSQAGPSGSGHGVATGVRAGADTPILSKTSNKLAMSPFPLSLLHRYRLGAVDQSRTHGVELDVPRGGEQIWFIEHE